MLQHSTDMYRFSYTSWLQLAAECGGCSQTMLMSPLTWNIWVHRDIPRPAGCGISPLKFEMTP